MNCLEEVQAVGTHQVVGKQLGASIAESCHGSQVQGGALWVFLQPSESWGWAEGPQQELWQERNTASA